MTSTILRTFWIRVELVPIMMLLAYPGNGSSVAGVFYGFLVSLLGFPIGYLLADIAKEELKDGKKYFKIIQGVAALARRGIFKKLWKNNMPEAAGDIFCHQPRHSPQEKT